MTGEKQTLMSFIKDAKLPNQQQAVKDRLAQFHYFPKETYIPPKCVLEFCGCRCMPLGDISAVSGKAKSGKTAFFAFLAEALFGKNQPEKMHATEHQISRIIYFDTEQTDNSVDSLAIKIRKRTQRNDIDNFMTFFCLRKADTELRIQIIEDFLSQFNIEGSGYSRNQNYVIVIDGLRDLMFDINNTTEATMMMNRLLKWTADYPNCAFVVVLHENPRNSDDKMMRGVIGTELENKMFTNFHIARNKSNKNIREISIGVSRGEETDEKLSFTFEEFGVPIFCEDCNEIFTEADKEDIKEKKPKASENHIQMILDSNHWQKGDVFTRSEFVDFFEKITGKKERIARTVLNNYEGIYWFSNGNTRTKTYKFAYAIDNEEEEYDDS